MSQLSQCFYYSLITGCYYSTALARNAMRECLHHTAMPVIYSVIVELFISHKCDFGALWIGLPVLSNTAEELLLLLVLCQARIIMLQ